MIIYKTNILDFYLIMISWTMCKTSVIEHTVNSAMGKGELNNQKLYIVKKYGPGHWDLVKIICPGGGVSDIFTEAEGQGKQFTHTLEQIVPISPQ